MPVIEHPSTNYSPRRSPATPADHLQGRWLHSEDECSRRRWSVPPVGCAGPARSKELLGEMAELAKIDRARVLDELGKLAFANMLDFIKLGRTGCRYRLLGPNPGAGRGHRRDRGRDHAGRGGQDRDEPGTQKGPVQARRQAWGANGSRDHRCRGVGPCVGWGTKSSAFVSDSASDVRRSRWMG